MKTILDTSIVAPADRQEFWIEEVIRSLDARWQVDTSRTDGKKFFGQLEAVRADNGVSFNRFHSDAIRLFRPFSLQTESDDRLLLASPAQFGGVVHVNGRECLCPTGRWILVDKRFPLSVASTQWRRHTTYTVDLPRRVLQEIIGYEVEMPRPWLLPNTLGTPAGLLCDTLNAGFRQMLRMSDPGRVSTFISEPVCNLLSLALAQTPADGQLGSVHVDEALRYMQHHYARQTLGPAQVSHALGISESLLYTRFAERGLRFSTELRRIRCEQAAQLLRDRQYLHWSVEAIAQATGFRRSAALIRAFRSQYATTPARYRNFYC
ncbi:MAG TPA: AraC family transcriptional regulator [Gammaproteobacteria bacterium]|nr:AraC family transcriptional regulator [Gammaproteobacteria bacterium]